MHMNLARLLTLIVLAVLTLPATGQVPRTLSYQGYLTNSAGQPFPNGFTQVIFRLFTAPSGGSAFWTESQFVEVTNGAFSATLGSVFAFNPATVPFDQPYYLEIAVNGASGLQTLSPRQPLAAAPYAIRAAGLSPSSCAVGSFVSGFNTAGTPVCSSTLQLTAASCNASAAGTLQWNEVKGIVEVCDGASTFRALTPVVTSFSGNPSNPVPPGQTAVMDATFTYQPQYFNSTLTVWGECSIGGFSTVSLMYGFGSGSPTIGLGPSVDVTTYRTNGNVQLPGLAPPFNGASTFGIQVFNPSVTPFGPNVDSALCGTVRFRVIETP